MDPSTQAPGNNSVDRAFSQFLLSPFHLVAEGSYGSANPKLLEIILHPQILTFSQRTLPAETDLTSGPGPGPAPEASD